MNTSAHGSQHRAVEVVNCQVEAHRCLRRERDGLVQIRPPRAADGAVLQATAVSADVVVHVRLLEAMRSGMARMPVCLPSARRGMARAVRLATCAVGETCLAEERLIHSREHLGLGRECKIRSCVDETGVVDEVAHETGHVDIPAKVGAPSQHHIVRTEVQACQGEAEEVPLTQICRQPSPCTDPEMGARNEQYSHWVTGYSKS
eukprot:CAMPEP_0119431418 /NCGR_PEP_ID=MMETSP1335-20130426/45870_1 /TAXON_ID=259385 /ORGANISM="Chrysoculter rhomboideus, Strain RCC1486" /LENGTH=203 /DNA_ID=CAMNT_0007457211 /DNA_START=309 /DNA_END=920 /DNA_ORIENTATION=-